MDQEVHTHLDKLSSSTLQDGRKSVTVGLGWLEIIVRSPDLGVASLGLAGHHGLMIVRGYGQATPSHTAGCAVPTIT